MRPWNRPEASGPTLQVPLKPRAGPDRRPHGWTWGGPAVSSENLAVLPASGAGCPAGWAERARGSDHSFLLAETDVTVLKRVLGGTQHGHATVLPAVDPVPEHSHGAGRRQRACWAAAPAPPAPGPGRHQQGPSPRAGPGHRASMGRTERVREAAWAGSHQPRFPRPPSLGRSGSGRPRTGASLSTPAPTPLCFLRQRQPQGLGSASGLRILTKGVSSSRRSHRPGAGFSIGKNTAEETAENKTRPPRPPAASPPAAPGTQGCSFCVPRPVEIKTNALLRFHGDVCDATQGSQEPTGPGTSEAGLPPPRRLWVQAALPRRPVQKSPGRRWVEPRSLVPAS